MKKLLLLTLGVFGIQAGILDTSPVTVFKKATSYEDSKVGFELINKSNRPIWIALTNGENTTRAHQIDSATSMTRHELRFTTIDIKKPTQLAVWYSNPGAVSFEKKYTIAGKKLFKPAPNKVYSFTIGKTLYLTWDKANYARPQSGPLGGALKKTDSNLSLKINVSKGDIKERAQGATA